MNLFDVDMIAIGDKIDLTIVSTRWHNLQLCFDSENMSIDELSAGLRNLTDLQLCYVLDFAYTAGQRTSDNCIEDPDMDLVNAVNKEMKRRAFLACTVPIEALKDKSDDAFLVLRKAPTNSEF